MANNSIRDISDKQLANGNTVDGDTLDHLTSDLVESLNAVQERHLLRRWTQTQFIQRLLPAHYNQSILRQDGPPFLSAYNSEDAHESVAPNPVDGYVNKHRLKGSDNTNIREDKSTEGLYAWTNTHFFSGPANLHSVSLRLHTEGNNTINYPNDFQYGANPPDGYVNGDPIEDLFIEVSIDNPFATEDRALNDVEIKKMRFPITSEMMSAETMIPPVNDITPASLALGSNKKPWVHLSNLNIPIKAGSRVRFTILVPKYDDAGPANVSGWGGTAQWEPWQSCWFSATVTYLEPLLRK